MSDLIRRVDVITVLCFCEETKMMLCKDLRKILEKIEGIPSAESERKKGHWIDTDNYYQRWKCSECGYHTRDAEPNYCPHCGADMRGDG